MGGERSILVWQDGLTSLEKVMVNAVSLFGDCPGIENRSSERLIEPNEDERGLSAVSRAGATVFIENLIHLTDDAEVASC